MMGELVLLRPARGERRLGRSLGISAASHLGLIVALTVPFPRASGTVERPERTPVADVRPVIIAAPPPPMTPLEPARKNEVVATATRPPAAKRQDESTAPKLERVPARLLQEALRLREALTPTPAYAVESLNLEVVQRFLREGWGRVFIGTPPFRTGEEVGAWPTHGEPLITPVRNDLSPELVSPRALRLPEQLIRKALGQPGASGSQPYLVVTPAIDLVVLSCQLAALERAGVKRDEVVLTVGQFAMGERGFEGLAISEIELVNGRTIHVNRN